MVGTLLVMLIEKDDKEEYFDSVFDDDLANGRVFCPLFNLCHFGGMKKKLHQAFDYALFSFVFFCQVPQFFLVRILLKAKLFRCGGDQTSHFFIRLIRCI